MKNTARRSGFTLIELLIVIAVIGILAAMLVPAANYVREKARKNECLNNLRQWGVAMQGYLDEHRGVFPGHGCAPAGKPDVKLASAWYNVLPPYIGETPLKDMPLGKLPHPGNGIKSLFLCPSEPVGLDAGDVAQNTSYFSSYALNSWIDWNKLKGTSFSQPLRLGQLSAEHVPPVQAAAFVVFAETGNGSAGGIDPSLLHENAFRHSRTFNVCFADGHVENVHMNSALPLDSLGPSDNRGGLQWDPQNSDLYGSVND